MFEFWYGLKAEKCLESRPLDVGFCYKLMRQGVLNIIGKNASFETVSNAMFLFYIIKRSNFKLTIIILLIVMFSIAKPSLVIFQLDFCFIRIKHQVNLRVWMLNWQLLY